MTAPNAPRIRWGTTGLVAVPLLVLGLETGLPWLIGPAIAVAGVAVSVAVRARPRSRTPQDALVPILAALVALTLFAPIAVSTELFAGASALAFLVWVADEPTPGGRGVARAFYPVALATLGFAFAWMLALAVPSTTVDVGLAGGLVAGALLIVTIVVARTVHRPREEIA